MKILIDINVIVDVVLARKEWQDDSAALMRAVAAKRARGYIAPHAATTVYYIVASANGRRDATAAVADVLQLCQVVSLTTDDFQRALALRLKDFEDGVTAAAAMVIGADYIATRNEKDFKNAPVAARSPAAILPLLRSALGFMRGTVIESSSLEEPNDEPWGESESDPLNQE